jgi:cytochrome c biogenesis protein CcmG/thiol:disulfide interchange protein DsbE
MFILVGGLVATTGFIAVLAMAETANPQDPTSPLVGKPAPNIAGPGINAGPQDLSRLAGRWVLVNFFASWCIPCRQEMPELNRFETEHASTGDAEVLGVEYDQRDLAAAPGFLRQYHVAFAAVDDPSADVSYGISGIPETYLVDPAGTVVAKYFGPITAAEIDGQITKLEAGR